MQTRIIMQAISPVVVLGCLFHSDVARCADTKSANSTREKIGEVLGKPVYRDQLRKEFPVVDELHRLFTKPVKEKYSAEHQAEVTPTQAELETAQKYFDQRHRERIRDKEPALREELKTVNEQLARDDLPKEKRKELELRKQILEVELSPPGMSFAKFILDNWKWQRHLYEKFGGGRILWQQGGTEAFDAMHKWLQAQEKSGQFQLTDANLRTQFYEYWTTKKHGPFLVDDKEEIREMFLEPEWLPGKK